MTVSLKAPHWSIIKPSNCTLDNYPTEIKTYVYVKPIHKYYNSLKYNSLKRNDPAILQQWLMVKQTDITIPWNVIQQLKEKSIKAHNKPEWVSRELF